DGVCSIGTVEDKILVPKPPKNCARCTRYGYLVDGPNCQGCVLLRQELEENLVTYSPDFQNSSEPSNASTNVVNAPREPYVVKQDNESFVDKIIFRAPDSPNQFYCFYCKDVLRDGEACKQCTCAKCGSGLGKVLCYICRHNQNSLNDSPSISETSSQSPRISIIVAMSVLNSTLAKIKDQMTSITSLCELACQVVQKILEEKQLKEERAAKAKYWKLLVCYDDDDDEEISDSLNDNIIFGLPPFSAITPDEPVLSTEEPDNSLSMGDEHLDTIPVMKSDEFIKSGVENLIPIPTFLNDDHSSDFKTKSSSTSLNSLLEETNNFDNSLPEFTTFLKVLFDAEYKSDSSDDQSCSDEDVLEKIVSKPLSEEEIIPMKSLRTHDSSLLISSKIDSLLEEFAGELTLLKSIPSGIDETDCDFEEDIRLIEKLLYDNSSLRPPKEFVFANFDAKIKSFSPSPILVKDSDSIMEEIDLFCTPDYRMPPCIVNKDYDSERDILIPKDLPRNNTLSFAEKVSFHFDIPLFSHPPAKPPDGDTGILNIKMMDVPQQYPCCDDCGLTRDAYQCQPMNEVYYYGQKSCYDSTSIGFDQSQPQQYTVDPPIFNAHNSYLDSQIQLNSTLANIQDQMTSITSLCEMACQVVQKKLEEKQIEEERAAKAKYWKLPVCYDDEERSDSLDDNIISGLPSFTVITPDEPVLSTEEPDNSLRMGDEHLDTIPATESDEFIKSGGETLIPIPSESEGIPEHTKSSSTSLNSLLEETNTFNNSFPEFENFYFDLGEISSGSTTTHSDISLSEYDSFIFEEFVDELAHIISPPEYECFYFRDLPDQ
nr:hypothetical protein [Tanacetum cinerariifolium]